MWLSLKIPYYIFIFSSPMLFPHSCLSFEVGTWRRTASPALSAKDKHFVRWEYVFTRKKWLHLWKFNLDWPIPCFQNTIMKYFCGLLIFMIINTVTVLSTVGNYDIFSHDSTDIATIELRFLVASIEKDKEFVNTTDFVCYWKVSVKVLRRFKSVDKLKKYI